MKFPQGEGSAVIHRKKNRPALQRRDILTDSLMSFFIFYIFFIGNLPSSSSTQFLVVLFFLAFYTDFFTSKHFLLGLLGFLFLFLSHFSECVDFTYSSFFLFFSGIFHESSTVLFFFLVLFYLAGLHCLLRMHAISSCVGDTWQRLWRDDFTHNGKQVVNRLKIPQGLSTLMFRRWSEVPSRGGVRGDSP